MPKFRGINCKSSSYSQVLLHISGKFHPSSVKICQNIWRQTSFGSTSERWKLWHSTNMAIFPWYMSSRNASNKPRNAVIIALKFLHEPRLKISYQFACNKKQRETFIKAVIQPDKSDKSITLKRIHCPPSVRHVCLLSRWPARTGYRSPPALWPAVGHQDTNRWPKSLRTLGTRLKLP